MKILEVSNIVRHFSGQKTNALNNISFSVDDGECIVISGANGSGKSVLMNLIAGLDTPTSGTITLNQNDTRVGLVFQDADSQILGDTPEEDVAFGPRNLKYSKETIDTVVKNSLKTVGLIGKEKNPARSLSGGEKRRLGVAGVIAMNASLLIFDEPFANLDWPGVIQVIEIILNLKKEGKTIIILTHELEKVLALSNRLIILFQGELVYDGNSEKALRETSLETWGIRNPLQTYTKYEDLLWKKIN
ncbi:MAG TPA: ABC transporter ATP-binding protein [Treponemataceae bacterium]|nr:ABC transporter ATP-binding protein [Treponemataceae bacterium]